VPSGTSKVGTAVGIAVTLISNVGDIVDSVGIIWGLLVGVGVENRACVVSGLGPEFRVGDGSGFLNTLLVGDNAGVFVGGS